MNSRHLAGSRIYCTLALLSSVVASAAEPHYVEYGEPVLVSTLENESINESSGLAISLRHHRHFWTHNDSGDKARLFCFDGEGRDLGEFKVKGADSKDWEDMSRLRHRNEDYLILADVGDNGRRRKHCELYVVREPVSLKQKARLTATIRFTYRQGPRDCEAIAVDANTNSVLLVGKLVGLAAPVYQLRLPESLEGQQEGVAERIGFVTLPPITAMDVSPDGMRMVLSTYGDAYQFAKTEPQEAWGVALRRNPRVVRLPKRRQGETICFGEDGRTLYLTSEKLPTPLWKIPPKS